MTEQRTGKATAEVFEQVILRRLGAKDDDVLVGPRHGVDVGVVRVADGVAMAMTADPVFSFNPELPDVKNIHQGRLIYYCGRIPNDTPTTTPAKIITESGWSLTLPNGTQDNPWTDVGWPKSQMIWADREEGASQVIVDNRATIAAIINDQTEDIPGKSGCSVAAGSGAAGGLGLGALAALLLARRRRVKRS